MDATYWIEHWKSLAERRASDLALLETRYTRLKCALENIREESHDESAVDWADEALTQIEALDRVIEANATSQPST